MRHHQRENRAFVGLVFLLSLALLLGPGACSPSRQAEPDLLQEEQWQVSDSQELPSLPVSQTSDYRVGTGDVMNILVYGEPDLTTIARVGGEGFIELPLIGQVRAAGLTLSELKQSIEERLKKGYLVNPDVQIILQEYKQDVVHLLGQVAAPGPYRITHSNTLLDTISKAGGFTPIAKRNKVKIIRKEDGKSIVFFVDTTRITEKGSLQDDVLLMPGDVIIVPERFF